MCSVFDKLSFLIQCSVLGSFRERYSQPPPKTSIIKKIAPKGHFFNLILISLTLLFNLPYDIIYTQPQSTIGEHE